MLALLSAAALAFPRPALAVTGTPKVAPLKNASATANIYAPLVIKKDNDLYFGLETVAAAGTAVLNPNTAQVTTTGGVTFVGGAPQAALFEGIAPVNNVVIISLPRTPTTVTRVGGTETMTVDTWTLDGSSRRTVPSRTAFTFKVGGTLHANANQVEGTYVGTFLVNVQYP